MEWISDVKFGVKDLSSGGVFTLKGYDSRITIHKLHGYGEGFYLSCRDFGFDRYNLETEDFSQAIEIAKDVMRKRVDHLQSIVEKFESDKGIKYTRY